MTDQRAFHDRDGLIWFDGEMIPWRDANVHVLTHALHYASSVFEGQRAYSGEIFKLTEHSERLVNSGRLLDFEIPYSVAEIDQACREVLAASGLATAICGRWSGAARTMGVSGRRPNPPGNRDVAVGPISARRRSAAASG